MKINKPYLFFALFFFAWSFFSFNSYDIAFFSQASIQYISGGFSFFKQQLFLIWAGVCFLILSLPFDWRKKHLHKFIYLSIAITLLLNLISHFYFSYLYDVPFVKSNVVVTDPHFTRSRLIHTHSFKPILMILIDSMGIDPISFRGDPGTSFYYLLPRWIFGIGLIFYFFSIVGMLAILKQKEREWKNEVKWPFVISYILASYVLIKSSVDGGPLSMEMIFYLPVFISLMRSSSYKQFLILLGIFILFTSLIYGVLYYNIDHELIRLSIKHVGGIVAFFFLINMAFLIYIKRGQGNGIVLILSFLFLFNHLPSSLWGISNRHAKKEANVGDRIYFSNYFKKNIPYPVKFQTDVLKIHEIKVEQPGLLGDYQKKFNIPPAYFNTSIVNKGCLEEFGFKRTGKVRIIDFTDIDFSRRADYLDSFHLEKCADRIECDYIYDAQVKGCMPDTTHELIIHQLIYMGFDSFVIVDRDSE